MSARGMMLEDFFTLTEMKDGISTVARIGELVSEIEKLKNVVTHNEADLIRQCSTAASTLASTKNEECLQHFIQLNGVVFLNQWLQDAQNCSKNANTSAEDLILAILTALECLPDNLQSTYCGILPTVQHLLAHANTKINQKARLLCDKWSSTPECCTDNQEVVTKEARQTDQPKLSEASQNTENNKIGGSHEAVIVEKELKPEVMLCPGVPLSNPSLTNDNSDIVKQPRLLTSADSSNGNAILGDMNSSVSSVVSHGSSEKLPVTEEISATNDEGLAINGLLRSDSLSAKSGVGQVAPQETTEAKSSELNKPEHSFVGRKMDVEDQNVPANLDIEEVESLSADMSRSEKNTMEDLNHLANVSLGMQDLSAEESMGKEAPTSSSDTNAEGTVNEFRLKRCMSSFADSSKAAETKFTALKGDKSTSAAEYDDTDALEVARLVAIEVEREVIDYRGPFCSSPDINSGHSDSPDLEARRQPEPPIDGSNDNKSSTTGDDSGSSSSLKEDGSGITDDSGPFSRKRRRDTELGDFDLNENQCPEETDCHTKSILSNSINLSTPIAVAASRASSVFPARLHFEGQHGWKGSAATSAFRPASPRRTPEGEKSMSATSQKASNMFDLNLADNDNAIVGEPLSTTIQLASVQSSRDTSIAVAVRGGIDLDLNFPCGDEETTIMTSNVPSFLNRERFTGNWNQPSSSSSSRQPSVKNFDLNDNMSLLYGSSRGADTSSVKSSRKDTSDLSAVTILGKRIVVGQQEQRQQIQHDFLGSSVQSVVHARSSQLYTHAPPNHSADSYPFQPALSFPPPFYASGGVPYMVDARGALVMPPLPGLGVGISHPSFSGRTIPPSSTELSYFDPSMGLNYGLSSEVAQTEEGSYWPVSFQGQTIFVDECMRNMSRGGSTSEVVSKRKEPESGLDLYPRR
ncbi:dentin sialophosphoprotein [Brachypodium distachyon]|uniref:TFIIS N-terminal domain-containing protein n=1 Tax=Brachypodium distachyon TaxID=15368 RepID=A0A0Q3H882_BRADI|nr:dentin sialophosphoprotein [Brachypodium distachyon]XP_014757743.1 dentin sialophosphoprotein [Brachypodium distachyon]XP_024318938.1 dentin sialophosphoprotein [Brachypodium distachyon]KQJ89561.1 hypothetical protein BRADI_4g26437v3 [Brachypodium distachyon]KQJ89562.1 hypothetical protein BRADI_4g26437v3 [Brachypodium distachyon]KQJ89563.1 hypothetical protein BRADI_4g26437v3 [Brachypodium distachyon]PNT64235.1 hypothetical protein BRADI_4g26437v3 [Brachypodium distachyon]PNT64236.1 hypo|eukprot:XP_010237973.1 dentin sialophosphoprotein [Brachypodium distachyon]